MGAMKSYLMWLEEKGYVELVCNQHDDWDYEPTNKHPGEAEAMNEYLTRQDAKKENGNG
jgi:hypothetical protein|tara:strand:- start:627 stop:803 length:177 start_codon:yes stop_codon:yes gene_type:complete